MIIFNIKFLMNPTPFGGAKDRPFPTTRKLTTFGTCLEDCLDNATYVLIDQDGGEVGEIPAFDADAQMYVWQWFLQFPDAFYTHKYNNLPD